LHFFISAHNKSTSIYGFSPEQLHFGFSNPAITDLIEIWAKTIDQQDYAKQIFFQIKKPDTQQERKRRPGTRTTSLTVIKNGKTRNFPPDKLSFTVNYK
jgi:hypothetical protein